ncbi:MAG: hypothetical protein AAF658_22235, partial [Myxococcota bacterium]
AASRRVPSGSTIGRDGREVLVALYTGGHRRVREICSDVFAEVAAGDQTALTVAACWGPGTLLGLDFVERARERLQRARGRNLFQLGSV